MRTIKTWLATIAVLLCSISARAQGDFYDQASGLSFKITSRTELTVEVASDLSVKPTTLIIPKNVTYDGKTYLVTSIESGALSSEHRIVSVSIPESVIEIKDRAFYGCNSLSSVSIHENSNLTSIGVEAFCCCKSLVSITIPKSVTEIKEDAFDGCI